jgi:hypothetical protein
MSYAVSIALLLMLLATVGSGPVRGGAAPTTKTFGGKVLEVNDRERWFVMQGGASKRYARVKILVAKTTSWTGVASKRNKLRPGDPVRVVAAPDTETAFRAVSVQVLDPSEKPVGASPSVSR